MPRKRYVGDKLAATARWVAVVLLAQQRSADPLALTRALTRHRRLPRWCRRVGNRCQRKIRAARMSRWTPNDNVTPAKLAYLATERGLSVRVWAEKLRQFDKVPADEPADVQALARFDGSVRCDY